MNKKSKLKKNKTQNLKGTVSCFFAVNPFLDNDILMEYKLLQNETNDISKKIFVDVSDLTELFKTKIYSYNCEETNDAETYLSSIISNDKNSIIDLLFSKSNDKDTDFFNKFISCYLFSDSSYDPDIVHFLIRYCFGSDNLLLQRDGINLLSLYKKQDNYLVDAFKGHIFKTDYLKSLYRKAIDNNESFC